MFTSFLGGEPCICRLATIKPKEINSYWPLFSSGEEMVAKGNRLIFDNRSVCNEEVIPTQNQAFAEPTVPDTVKNGTV